MIVDTVIVTIIVLVLTACGPLLLAVPHSRAMQLDGAAAREKVPHGLRHAIVLGVVLGVVVRALEGPLDHHSILEHELVRGLISQHLLDEGLGLCIVRGL